jgi:predicted PurR-regulated permease PerM
VGTLRSSRRWTVQGGKLLLVGLLLLCVIPVSLKISDAIYDRYQESINVTISNAEELSETADELVQAQEDQGLFNKILGTIKETTGGLTQRAAETLNRFVEAMAVMIVTSCVIPILVLLFLAWVVKQLTGVDLRDFAPRRPRREAREEEEAQQRVSI